MNFLHSAQAPGMGIAIAAGLLYLFLRLLAWSPGDGDPRNSARSHALWTAAIAFLPPPPRGCADSPRRSGYWHGGARLSAGPRAPRTPGGGMRYDGEDGWTTTRMAIGFALLVVAAVVASWPSQEFLRAAEPAEPRSARVPS